MHIGNWFAPLAVGFVLISCFAECSTLKKEATFSRGTLIACKWTAL
jgi:hypothetical protein